MKGKHMNSQHFNLKALAQALAKAEPSAKAGQTAWQRIRSMLTPETRLEAKEASKRGRPGEPDALKEAFISEGMTPKTAGVRASNWRGIIRAYVDLNFLASPEVSFYDAYSEAAKRLREAKALRTQAEINRERDIMLAEVIRENPEVDNLAEVKAIAESRMTALTEDQIAAAAVKGLLAAYSNSVCHRIITGLQAALPEREGTVGAEWGNREGKKLFGDASTIQHEAERESRPARRSRPERRPSNAVNIDPAEYTATTETDKEPEPETEPAIAE